MILKGSQRGGAKNLGLHLLKTDENEHVELYEIRGFMAGDVVGALREAEAIAKGTRCKQFLFSVSLSPPQQESVRPEVFEAALEKIEERNGLTGQPRVVVFHEKEGRRHAHAVWSRIDPETMTAKPLPFFKTRLREVSKELYLEHGWQMPRGLVDSKERDPRNFTLAEWQQAKRIGMNAKDLKSMVQECWAVSDNRQSFAKALEERGLYLAKGDRRGHVAVTYEGEVLSIPRIIGKKTKEVSARLGPADDLASVAGTRTRIAESIMPRLDGYMKEAQAAVRKEMGPLNQQRLSMQAYHQAERQRIDAGLKARHEQETHDRAERIRKGFRGIWDRLTGEHAKVRKQNEIEAFFALQRDREQRHALVQAQLRERQELQSQIVQARARHAQQLRELHEDAANYRLMQRGEVPKMRDAFDRLNTLRQDADMGQHQRIQRLRDPKAHLSPQDRLDRLRSGERKDGPEHDLER